MKTIDLTPTWREAAAIAVAVLTHTDNEKARKDATIELLRMADLADKYVAVVKHMKGEV